jgi:hypothetical protein
MNLMTKIAAKIVEELSQTNEMNDTDKEGMQHTKAKLRVFLRKKWRSKEMLGQYNRSIDRLLLVKTMCSYGFRMELRQQNLKVRY